MSAGSGERSISRVTTEVTPIERELKVVMLGESGVGKSSITQKFVTGIFRDDMVSTIGASFLTKVIAYSPVTKFNIWDTAGQEKYRALAALYYRGVDCAIIVYDITSVNSFNMVREYWIHELLRQSDNSENIKICLVGSKCDLDDQREVSSSDGEMIANNYGALFFEASSKQNINIEEIFIGLAKVVPLKETKPVKPAYILDVKPKRPKKCC